MFISEVFYSIQGEGSLVGVPSVFIRTSGCNLRCRWCDTPYASWNPEGTERRVEDLVEEVKRSPARHVVLTGGEPMVAKGVAELASALRADGYHLTLETAGTVSPGGLVCDLASISPKLSTSTPDEEQAGPWRQRHEATRLQPAVIREWIGTAVDYQLKFVATAPADLEEIDALLAQIGRPVEPHRVLLMPEGTRLESLRAKAGWVSEACKERGFRYAHRLHVELYGNRRGT